MIEDMLQLTVDVLYPKNALKKQGKKRGSPLKTQTASKFNQPDQDRKTELAMINEEEKVDPLEDQEPTNMSRVHPVTGYSDTENMWVKLCNVEKNVQVENRYQNDKSLTTIQVSDKIFKLKKNPLYKDFPKLSELM